MGRRNGLGCFFFFLSTQTLSVSLLFQIHKDGKIYYMYLEFISHVRSSFRFHVEWWLVFE